jgi:hypothetical protein
MVAAPFAQIDWKERLELDLQSSGWQKTSVSKLDGNRVLYEGTPFVLKRGGILGSPARHFGAVNTKVRGDRVIQPGGFSAFFAERSTMQFSEGDVVYVTDVEVRNDSVVVEVVSRDMVPTVNRRETVYTRYKGQVEFELDREFLRSASADDLVRVFSTVLVAE